MQFMHDYNLIGKYSDLMELMMFIMVLNVEYLLYVGMFCVSCRASCEEYEFYHESSVYLLY